MKHYNNTQEFYKSQDWFNCKQQVLNERMRGGVVYCEKCGQPIVKGFNPNANNNKGAMVFHHVKYLNNQNVNDASISINPKNIQILHWSCHNEVHERFTGQKKEKKVYIITGADFSGKRTFVNERCQYGDIIVDIDTIWQSVVGKRYIKPNSLKNLVFMIRQSIKEYIRKSGFDNWRNAWIIENLASERDIETEADKYKNYNVEVITMDTPKEECLRRLHENPNGRDIKEYEKYIDDYFRRASQ